MDTVKSDFSNQIKKSIGGDEYYTKAYAVRVIVPYLKAKGYTHVWCPFDKAHSQFVTVLREEGFTVYHSHIEDGVDFFEAMPPRNAQVIVSNPPFSKRQQVLERLFEIGLPFAMILNFNGLFDSKARWSLFKNNQFEMLVPVGRMAFDTDRELTNSPNFQSIYICSYVLDKQIEFCDMVKE